MSGAYEEPEFEDEDLEDADLEDDETEEIDFDLDPNFLPGDEDEDS
jgi:hypothetical protein